MTAQHGGRQLLQLPSKPPFVGGSCGVGCSSNTKQQPDCRLHGVRPLRDCGGMKRMVLLFGCRLLCGNGLRFGHGSGTRYVKEKGKRKLCFCD